MALTRIKPRESPRGQRRAGALLDKPKGIHD